MNERNMYLPIFLVTFLFAGFHCEEDMFSIINKINTLGKGLDESAQGEDGMFGEGDAKEKITETLMEGDIVVTEDLLGDIALMEHQSDAGITVFDAIKNGVWTNHYVPYTFANARDEKNLKASVQKAVDIYSENTCIKWEHIKKEVIKSKKNYVEFFSGGGCYSMIGMQRSGPQKISLQFPGCTRALGTVIHEMMHALGFFHEQSRMDRDNYVVIYWNNISPRMNYNFKKYRPGQADTFGEPYDKKSVMHYGGTAFSWNGKKTIVSKKSRNEKLGQRKSLSEIDIRQLNKYYECKTTVNGKKIGEKTGTGTGTSDGCTDGYPKFCYLLKSKCTHTWVQTNCKKTCDKCIKKPEPPCNDNSQYCGGWAKKKFCGSSLYRTYMETNCKKTCNKC